MWNNRKNSIQLVNIMIRLYNTLALPGSIHQRQKFFRKSKRMIEGRQTRNETVRKEMSVNCWRKRGER